MATGDTTFNSHGDARPVSLLYTVTHNQLAYIGGQLGITDNSGASGQSVSLDVSDDIRVIVLPAAFAGAIGDKVFIDVTDLTGHTPDDTAYGKSAGANIILLGVLITAQDANNRARIMRVGKGLIAS